MDILTSIISEMNRYDETAKEAVKYLNIKPEDSIFNIDVFQGKNKLGETTIYQHPLVNEIFNMDIFVSDISKYKYPKVENNNERCNVSKETCTDIIPENAPVSVALKNIVSEEKKSEWIYLTIDITKSKIIQQGKDIIIESENNMRYKFTKKKTYSYLF